jgi:hypothetical protein
MAYLILIVLIGAVVIDRLHRAHIHNRTLVAEYRLYELRDHLRSLSIRGEVSSQNWVFQYLDSIISTTILNINKYSFWQVFAVALTYRHDERYLRFKNQLERELSKPSNSSLSKVNQIFIGQMILYLIARHAFIRLVIRYLTFTSSVKNELKNRFLRVVQVKAYEPSISESFLQAQVA